MIDVMQSLSVLGKKVRDKITRLEGVASSVSFDLYGCVCVIINPGVGADGKIQECLWFDINRIEVVSDERVMPLPEFNVDKGPETKPLRV